MIRSLATTFAALLLLLPLSGAPAWAHKVIASVYATGDHIEGEIGFSNGDMAKNAEVDVLDEDGNRLGQVTTDADGFFTYKPEKRIVHVFRANLGAGHVANARMEIEDLPDIPGAAEAGTSATTTAQSTGTSNAGTPDRGNAGGSADTPSTASAAALGAAQKEELSRLIHREVRPLQQEIMALKEKNGFQSVLGGIGYIAGLFGLGFYLAARRKLAAAREAER